MKIFINLIFCTLLFKSALSNDSIKIMQLEQLRYQAMIQVDTEFLQQAMAANVVYIHSNGMVDSKTSLIHSIVTKELIHKKITTTHEHVRFYKRKFAIVNGESIYEINWRGQDMILHFYHTNVYYKVKRKWILINRQTSKIT